MSEHTLTVDIRPQPDDETCGPTCLHAVYQYWNDGISLTDVIESFRTVTDKGQGTLAVMLGVDALRREYRAHLFTFNVQVFDPTWFDKRGDASAERLTDKLTRQLEAKSKSEKQPADSRIGVATASYLEFLRLGGQIHFRELNSVLISRLLRERGPILTGLSATYLYRCAREFGPSDVYDDIRGEPTGHFVVINGFNPVKRQVSISDPLADNPGFASQHYQVPMSRLIASIMLGVLTYDANLLVIEPEKKPTPLNQKTNRGDQ
ncbi:MAG: hypothetical protein WA888_15760 [Burkholderiaceae bacterium]